MRKKVCIIAALVTIQQGWLSQGEGHDMELLVIMYLFIFKGKQIYDHSTFKKVLEYGGAVTTEA